MRRWTRYLALAAIAWLLPGFWMTGTALADPVAAAGGRRFNEGTIAPGFELEDLEGRPVALEDYRGKVVLIDFWATW